MAYRTIINYDGNVRYGKQNTDDITASSNLLLQQDATGVPTAQMVAGEVAVDATGKNVNFQLIMGTYASIQYVCTGLLEDLDGGGVGLGTYSQRTEVRVLEYGINETTKYTIGGILQGYVPELPGEVQIVLNNLAFIGHPDTVDSVNTTTDVFQYFSAYGSIIV